MWGRQPKFIDLDLLPLDHSHQLSTYYSLLIFLFSSSTITFYNNLYCFIYNMSNHLNSFSTQLMQFLHFNFILCSIFFFIDQTFQSIQVTTLLISLLSYNIYFSILSESSCHKKNIRPLPIFLYPFILIFYVLLITTIHYISFILEASLYSVYINILLINKKKRSHMLRLSISVSNAMS